MVPLKSPPSSERENRGWGASHHGFFSSSTGRPFLSFCAPLGRAVQRRAERHGKTARNRNRITGREWGRAGNHSIFLASWDGVCHRWRVDPTEETYLRAHRSHDISHLLSRWRRVARKAGLKVETLAEEGGYPVVALTNRRPPESGRGLYLSAGIHGDEPAAVAGLLEWAESHLPVLRNHPVTIFPCVNPWGLANNSRTDRAGHDLNRAFDRTCAAPVGAMLDFLEGRRFAIAVNLHEDYDANGAYLYELARRGEGAGQELLDRVERELPRHRGMVEGRRTRRGVLRRSRGLEEISKQIEGMPEAIYLYLHHARTAFTFETPSEFSLYRRTRAQVRFLEGVTELLDR